MKSKLTKTKEKIKELPFRPNWSKSKKNKILLGTFLFIIFVTIALKVAVTILWDIGYYQGKVHLWYWHNEDVNEILMKTHWGERPTLDMASVPGATEAAKLTNIEFAHRAKVHPYFFWSLTQFTWQTTLLITFILSFRLFMYDDRVPKWLRWTHSQRTLSIVTMYDIIVGVVFWAALAKDFGQINDSSDRIMNNLISATTILVHAVIPFCMVVYSLIYLLLSTEASILNKKFLLLGIIYPSGYILFYLLMSIIWLDPYPVSNLATTHDFSQLWIAFLGLVGIFIGLGGMMYIHNTILFKFNKKYRYEYDYEVITDLNKKIEKVKWKIEKSKRKISSSINEAVIKKEKITLAKRELSLIKAEYSIKKLRSRAERHEKEWNEKTEKRKQSKAVVKKTPAKKVITGNGKTKPISKTKKPRKK